MANKQKWYGNKAILENALKEKTVREVAEEFGVYFKTVVNACKDLGINHDSKKIEYDRATAKINQALKVNPNATAVELSNITGVSESSIWIRAKRKEIKLAGSRRKVVLELDTISEMCKTMSASQIAKELGAGVSRVAKFIKDNGLKANSQWYNKKVASGELKHWTQLEKNKHRLTSAQPKNVKKKETPKTISTAAQIIWPENVKVTVYQRENLDDPRNVMSKPIYNQSERGISWRY